VEASESETASLAVDDTYYGIQVMAGSRELKCDDRAFKGHAVHWVKTDSGIYKYIIGKYSSNEEAKNALPDVKKDFPDAFVIKVKGNEVSRP
jgi:hypothetical protein